MHSRRFTHSKFIALKSKDAIVDYFRNTTGRRPSVDLQFPHLRINIHIEDVQCTVSIDSSGQSLHKRGYKKYNSAAPLNEVLAAGIILMSAWDKKSDLFDILAFGVTLGAAYFYNKLFGVGISHTWHCMLPIPYRHA